ncbi:hypothetical protein ACHHYP_06008 [Achlya hypogyna]|uniref:Uncharacterized protein n=1 Tax=Achlya hypogyna TaxID=1202772 RepID=A0A1V9ZNA4_ACHHY|nr:hypothetical protein ACHHYP_06008 [Achlya hypogyna]
MRELLLGGVTCVADSFLTPGVSIEIVIWTDAQQYELLRTAAEKPRALTCSGDDYLAQLHAAFHCGNNGLHITGVARSSAVEVVVEEIHTEMHLQFDAMVLVPTVAPARHVLGVAQRWHCDYSLMVQSLETSKARIAELEALVAEKDLALEAAVQAKVATENHIVQKCLLLLNAKKEKIVALQEQLNARPDTPPAKRSRKTPVKRSTQPKKALLPPSSSESADEVPSEGSESDASVTASAADLTSQAYAKAVPHSTSQFYSADQILEEVAAQNRSPPKKPEYSPPADVEDDFLDML